MFKQRVKVRLNVIYFVIGMLLIGSTISFAQAASVSVGYGGPPTARDYVKEILKEVEEKLPEVQIKEVVYPTYEDMLALLPPQIAANTAPDIVWWTAGDVMDYFIKGVVEPLDDVDIVDSLGVDLEEYIPAAVRAFTYDDKLYGIPLQAQSSAFAINTDLMKKAGIQELPASLDEVLEGAIKVKDKTGKAGLVLHLQAFHITHYIKAFGGGWGYGKTINSAANKKGLQFLVDLFTKYNVATTPRDFGCAWDGEVFSRGEVAFSTGGTWYIGYMRTMSPEFEYVLAPVPSVTKGDSFVLLDSGGWSVLKSAKDKNAVLKVLSYLTSDKAQQLLYTTPLLYIPAKEKFLDAYANSVPEFALLKDQFLDGINFDYPFEELKKFNDDLVAGFEQLIYKPGSMAVEDLLDSLQEKYGRN